MIRSLRQLLAVVAAVTFAITLAGCDSGGTADDAPKAGARRPAPDNTRTAPGPGSEGLGTGGTEPTGTGTQTDPGDGG